jgi:hypothetical protein
MTQPATSRDAPARIAPSRSHGLLRLTGIVGFLAALMGVLIAPGLRGLAGDRVVDLSNHFAWTLAYFFSGLLVALIGVAAYELSRTGRFHNVWKGMGVSAAGLAAALAAPALLRPLPTIEAAVLALVTSFVVFTAASHAFRARHTRAVALLMTAFAMAGLLRVVAWDLARVAGDSGNASLYAKARGLATVAVGFEVIGQAVAAAWLGTRSRFGGQALSSLAIGLAWILTYGAAQGASTSARPWEVASHIALATASALPEPYGPHGLMVFLLASSILLAGVAAVQRRQAVAVVVALSLSLLGRGAFDIPIHALAACAAALWLTMAVTDERALWQSLLAARAPGGARPPASRTAGEAGSAPIPPGASGISG